MAACSNCGERCSLCVSGERFGIGVFELDFSTGGWRISWWGSWCDEWDDI